MYKGHILAREEITPGRSPREAQDRDDQADENAGTDANVKGRAG